MAKDNENNKSRSEEEKRKENLRNGKVIGTASVITGGTALGLGYGAQASRKYIPGSIKFRKIDRALTEMSRRAKTPEGAKNIGQLKGLGTGMILAGSGLAGYSAYKHYKDKKIKEKEKAENESPKE